MMRWYKLIGKLAVPVRDVLEMGLWLEMNDRRVAETTLGPVWISTVFLGLDHQWDDDGPPMIFESMVFMDREDQEMNRYSSWDEAEKGHAKLVEKYQKIVADTEPVTQWFARLEGK